MSKAVNKTPRALALANFNLVIELYPKFPQTISLRQELS